MLSALCIMELLDLVNGFGKEITAAKYINLKK